MFGRIYISIFQEVNVVLYFDFKRACIFFFRIMLTSFTGYTVYVL